jgi:Tol biopolymer transport system component
MMLHRRLRPIIPFLVCASLIATACDTLEVGIERTAIPDLATSPVAPTESLPPTPGITPTPLTEAGGPGPTATPETTPAPPTIRARVATNPSYQPNDHSSSPAISADGRHVAFLSSGDNLVPGDTNAQADIFIYDRETHTTELISLGRDGSPANGSSGEPSISADGRWVVFSSTASNLAPGDTNDTEDVFVHDRQTGRTTLVSMAVGGRSGNGTSTQPSISADGRWIVFESAAEDLLPEIDEHTGEEIADTNRTTDIFVYDRPGRSIRRANLSNDGEQSNRHSSSPDISADGRWVVFWSLADNLVAGADGGIYLRDRATGTTQWIADGTAPSISPDGRWIGFLPARGSGNQISDDVSYAALYERETGKAIVIGGYARGGIEGRPSKAIQLSADGKWLALRSVFDTPDSPLAGDSGEWGQQVFLRDQRTGAFTLLSATPAGVPGNNVSGSPSLSADGRWIAFQSLADNLVTNDTNGRMDIFVYDRETATIEMVSWAVKP